MAAYAVLQASLLSVSLFLVYTVELYHCPMADCAVCILQVKQLSDDYTP